MRDFAPLHQLADLLDLHLGVATRKAILEGNEKLTQKTDDVAWSNWVTGVGSRLRQVSSDRPNQDILLNVWSRLSSIKDSPSDSR
jgi:hypothetical protein